MYMTSRGDEGGAGGGKILLAKAKKIIGEKAVHVSLSSHVYSFRHSRNKSCLPQAAARRAGVGRGKGGVR